MQVQLKVNGKAVTVDAAPHTLLVQTLQLTGTHVGCDTAQCGFCTLGMVMSAVSLCQQHPNAKATQIRELLESNLCRCTGYQNIVGAGQQGAAGLTA